MNTCCSVVLSFDLAGESVSEVIPKGKIERIRTQRRYSKACSWSVQYFSTLGSFTQGLLIVQQILLQHLSQHLDMSWYSYTLKQPILRRLKHRHHLSTPIFLLIKTVSLKSQQDFPKCQISPVIKMSSEQLLHQISQRLYSTTLKRESCINPSKSSESTHKRPAECVKVPSTD